jgi:hypothetical protein
VHTRRLTTDELAELAKKMIGLPGAGLTVFIESPTRSDFRAGTQLKTDWANDLATAWWLRVFGEEIELAARHLGPVADSKWQARLVMTPATAQALIEGGVPHQGWQSSGEKSLDDETSVFLLGSWRDGGDNKGKRFREDQYATATDSMQYPGQWNDDDNAALRVRSLTIDGVKINTWVGFLRRTGRGPTTP